MNKTLLVIGLLLFFIPLVSATIDVAPKNPTIRGNGWIFMTFNDTVLAGQSINITLYDNNGVLKTSCIRTINARGFTNSTCKYSFVQSDTSGEWMFSVNTTTPENRSINVSKIQVTLTDRYNSTSISYGSRVKLLVNMSYEGVMPKEIRSEVLSRDIGAHLINTFEDADGDGDKEIVVPEIGGYLYIWQNLTRLFDGVPIVADKDFQSADFGAGYAQARSCHFGDFDGDGKNTMICADTAGRLKSYININITKGAAAVNLINHTSEDFGSYRGDIEICDVNNDGIYDQVVGSTYEGTIVFFQYNESDGFTWLYNSTDWGANAQNSRSLCGDFDGDGYNEWIIWEGATGVRFVDINLSAANYTPTTPVPATDRGAYLQGSIIDYDKDGILEVVFPLTTGYLQVLRWNGAALVENMTWQGEGTDITDFVAGSSGIYPDDLDHDGYDDFMLTGSVNHPPLLFYKYDPDNTARFNRTVIDYITEQSTSRVEYADFDGDGFKEVIAFGRYSGNTYIYKYNGISWDLVYKGWAIGDEDAWSGDAILYGATPVNGWSTGGCASGDMDYDGKDELLCTPYDGNFILYQEMDIEEHEVTPTLTATQTINDGSYEHINSICPELRLKESGTNLCIQSTNILLGNNNSVDEDNQDQGSIASRWTDGIVSTATYRSTQVAIDYATLDASAVTMATYSRIKLGTNYTIGKIVMRNYHSDGRSFNNVVLQSTTDDTGNLCDWTNPTTLYNNTDGGPNRKYSESSVGRRLYVEPTSMSCFRESTAGSNYAATVANTANYRTELEMYLASSMVYYGAALEREDESTLSIGDNWTTTLQLADRTGFVVNMSTSYTLPVVNISWCPAIYNAIIISNDATTPLIIT